MPGHTAAPTRRRWLAAAASSDRCAPTHAATIATSRNSAGTDLVTLLTQAPLVRVNRATDELEPWLAERWTASADGRTYTLTLRAMTFSDGVPFTSADVLFAFEAIYDDRVKSPLKSSLEVDAQPLQVSAPDASTVVITFPAPFGPGLRILDNLPILPKHKLGAALAAGTLAASWTPGQPLDTVAGLGPFVLREHASGERMVFVRNPHYFRRDATGTPLPYLDSLTMLDRARSNDGGAAPAGRRDRPDG